MSRLERLIAELCPDGVKYKALGEFGTLIRGHGLQKKDFTETGVGCIHYGQIYTHYGAFAYETKTFVSPELAKQLKKVNKGDLVIAITSENVEDVCKCVAWLGDEEIVTGGHSAIFKHNQDPKYLSYYFQTSDFFTQKKKIANGTKVIEVSPQKLAQVVIPLPPLPVQREIVRILDNFTELTARKKQYEYYRDFLLTQVNKNSVKWMSLKDCTLPTTNIKWSFEDEKTYKYIDLTSVDRDLHRIVETQSINKNNAPSRAQQIVKTGDVLFGATRPLLKRYCLVSSEFNNQICSTGFCVLRANTEIVLQKWILFQIASSAFYSYVEKYQQGASYPAISDTNVKNYLIPIPPLEEQKRIVAILDRFDNLCNDLTSGIPAEIEARRKQYEYYRDKLLTFKEAKA